MKLTNFFHQAPHWINNSLAAVITLLLTINQIVPQVSDLFGILDCQSCIDICQKVLAIVAIVLSILKIFSKIPEQINSEQSSVEIQTLAPMPKRKAKRVKTSIPTDK